MGNRDKNLETAMGNLRSASAKTRLYNTENMPHLLDTMSDMVGVYELEEAHFVSINKSWIDVLGWTEEEFCSMPFFNKVHPQDVKRTQEAYTQMREGQTFKDYLFTNRYLHKKGHYVELQWNVRKADNYNGYAMAVARPIRTLRVDDKLKPSMISTIFYDGQKDKPMTVSTNFVELFEGMLCRDLAPNSEDIHLWQCITTKDAKVAMPMHRHPHQIEKVNVIRGELTMKYQVPTIWQRLGLSDRMVIKRTKTVTLRAGQSIVFGSKTWHEVLPNFAGSNYTVRWTPKYYETD